MHPVDQYEAVAALEMPADRIAARYGMTEAAVRQRLALGALHPTVRKAWRDGAIDAEVAKAFTLTRDAGRQAKVLGDLRQGGRLYKHAVRQAFVADRPRTDDPRFVFVGAEAYRAAGGTVDEDLFAEHGFVGDVELLDRLVAEAIRDVCHGLLGDGWAFAELDERHEWPRPYRAAEPEAEGKPTPVEAKRLKSIAAELRKIDAADETTGEDDHRREALECEQAEINKRVTARGFTFAQRAQLGCLVALDEWGLAIEWGMRRVAVKGAAAPPAEVTAADVRPDPNDPTALPLALLADVTAAQTHAVAQCLEVDPALAIKIAAAALRSTFDGYGVGNSPVRLKAEGMAQRVGKPERDDDPPEDAAGVASSGFAAAMAEITREDAPLALARELARAIDTRHLKYKPVCQLDIDALLAELPPIVYAAKLLGGLALEDYFKRAPAAVAVAALEEMGETPLRNARKAALVERAVEMARHRKWIPPVLRHPGHKAAIAETAPSAAKAPAKGKGNAKRKADTTAGRRA
jgi:ParB family chromosome partitioning protein